jgi:multidrug efflux system outer membrane protein
MMTTRKLNLMMLTGVVVLSGCQILPEFSKPAAPIPEKFPVVAEPAEAPAAVTVADIGWNEFFLNPDLRQTIAAALISNRDLKTAALRIEEARAMYNIQRSDRLPTVNGTAGVSDSRQLLAGEMRDITAYQVGVGMTAFELDFFGRVKNLSEAALAQFFATEEAQRAMQVSLVGEVAKAWLTERGLSEQIALAERTLKARTTSYGLVKQRFDAGITNALELRQSETLVQTARSAVLSLKRQHALSINALALLVGTSITPATQSANLSSQAVTADIGAGLSSELLTHRPDIRAAEQRLRSTQANIAAARAAFFPRISLTAGLGLASTELGDLFQGNSATWNFAPQLVLPIFDAGRNKANLSLAEVRSDIAIASYEKTIQVAFREVADALSARATLSDEITAQEAVRAAQAARLELAQARYKNGIANYLEVLDAERELFAAEQQLLQTKLLKITNTVDLYRSLGGGLNEVSQQTLK